MTAPSTSQAVEAADPRAAWIETTKRLFNRWDEDKFITAARERLGDPKEVVRAKRDQENASRSAFYAHIVNPPLPLAGDAPKQILENTQIIRDVADDISQNGFSVSGEAIHEAARQIEQAILHPVIAPKQGQVNPAACECGSVQGPKP